MKNRILNVLMVVAITMAIVGCKKAKEAETTAAEETAEATVVSTEYTVDTTASTITWKGFKPTGSHHGAIALESGVLTVKDGLVESGTFKVDMGSLEVNDIPADDEMNGKLTGHLKSADFFDVEAFPTSEFTVTGSEKKDGALMLSGNLKMKDATNNITIPVTLNETEDSVTLTSETFSIDRSKWNVKYGSKSFFDDLGDKFINDDVELKISLTANKS
ncbi:YceI family protein [Mangrovimonas sp. ST2L15]|uniref:YceI family protein n=1 Tax=Mangrovimonas sp. ST2L15 TaxID=1645916 RepID=UPI0006B5B35B|nr:YceI family protein [Mangrovimonas sp. ST2L15]